jgi:hypothetical protein
MPHSESHISYPFFPEVDICIFVLQRLDLQQKLDALLEQSNAVFAAAPPAATKSKCVVYYNFSFFVSVLSTFCCAPLIFDCFFGIPIFFP